MKILYAITALGFGGAENLLVDVCQELTKRHTITVVFLLDKRAFEPYFTEMGIETIFVDYAKKGFIGSVSEVKRIIKERNIEIVHTHLPRADFIGRIAGLLCPKVKILSTIHNSDRWKLHITPEHLILKAVNFFTVNFSKRVKLIAVSNSCKEFCLKHDLIRASKITVIYNFINYNNPVKTEPGFIFPYDNSKHFTMLFAARLEENKGLPILLLALEKLIENERYKDIRLLILGEGSIRFELEGYVRKLNLSGNVIFLGYKKNVYDYLKNSHLFILPSRNEGLSITILEAFYCQTPVLASNIPANVEVLREGKNGVLFIEGDSIDLADKISNFADGNYKTETILKNANQFCIHLTKERHIKTLEAIMHSFLMSPS